MKIIKLKSNGLGRYDDVSPFIIADNALTVKIDLPPYNGEFYFVAENNGNKLKLTIPQSGEIALGGLSAGELNAEVKHYLKGELIKVYKVEPLLLMELDGTLSAMPEIEALRHDREEIKQSFSEYKQRTAERKKALNERVEKLEKLVCALLAFAYDDYKENVYLGGGTVQDFVSKYGFELNNEQIKFLEGEEDEQD
ncbi:MAG: hypothetical protein K2K80_05555 [Clostridia bacterium]|nr:hypothetical protein [Clostridia bacterium]